MWRFSFRLFSNVAGKARKGVRGELPQPTSFSPENIHKVFAYSYSESLNLKELEKILTKRNSTYKIKSIKNNSINAKFISRHDADLFFFKNGTFVAWLQDSPQYENKSNLDTMAETIIKDCDKSNNVQTNRYNFIETENFDYTIDMNESGGLRGDLIVIGNEVPEYQSKLAFSEGISRSVKLASLEEQLDSHLNQTKKIPLQLLSADKLTVSRSQVLMTLGKLLSFRGLVNLHSELLDSPDFCWSHPDLESYFNQISKNLDVNPRIAIFNKKLDYANELAQVLKSHLSEKHSLKLEWFIIILIAVEVGFEIVHYLERLGYIQIEKIGKNSD